MTREKWCALVQRCWRNVQQVMVVAPSGSACLFGEEGKGLRLIKHAQFALGIVIGSRVEIDPSLNQIAVKVCHQGAGITRGHAPFTAVSEKGMYRWICIADSRVVHAVYFFLCRELHVGVRKEKLSNGRVKCEAIDSSPCGIHQHGRTAIEYITSGYEVAGWLQEIRWRSGLGQRRLAAVNSKDGSD